MITSLPKKASSNHLNEHFSIMKTQRDSQVRKILRDLSVTKDKEIKNMSNSLSHSIFTLKMAINDPDIVQRRKYQLRNQFSPPKWKVSTNFNSDFGHHERVKGKLITGWDMQRTHMSKRSYENPKQFHGLKYDFFSRQFSQDLSKNYSKGLNKKLKQIQIKYERKVFEGNIKTLEQRKQRFMDGIKSKGIRFQLSKDKLFGFVPPIKDLPTKQCSLRNTISHFDHNPKSSMQN